MTNFAQNRCRIVLVHSGLNKLFIALHSALVFIDQTSDITTLNNCDILILRIPTYGFFRRGITSSPKLLYLKFESLSIFHGVQQKRRRAWFSECEKDKQ